MSDNTAALIHDLAVKGFLPLVLIGAVLFGAYLLFDRALDALEAQNQFIRGEVVKGVIDLYDKLDAVETACKPKGVRQ